MQYIHTTLFGCSDVDAFGAIVLCVCMVYVYVCLCPVCVLLVFLTLHSGSAAAPAALQLRACSLNGIEAARLVQCLNRKQLNCRGWRKAAPDRHEGRTPSFSVSIA